MISEYSEWTNQSMSPTPKHTSWLPEKHPSQLTLYVRFLLKNKKVKYKPFGSVKDIF